jgi:hypothetical protein
VLKAEQKHYGNIRQGTSANNKWRPDDHTDDTLVSFVLQVVRMIILEFHMMNSRVTFKPDFEEQKRTVHEVFVHCPLKERS